MSILGFPLRVLAIVGGHDAPSPIAAAVGQLGHCSATLVRPTLVLTSAHCLDGPVDRVTINGSDVAVTACERHPAYQPGQVAHDLGYCRLATSVTGALPVDAAHRHGPGETVSIAGFGASAAMAREKPALRIASTSVVRADDNHFDIGTATVTACRGDSGGPVLVERGAAFGVTGIIEGTQGVICGSVSRAVPLEPQMDWLRAALADKPEHSARPTALALALVVVVIAAVGLLAVPRWRRATRAG
jgi:secreted trypsin-like serine protease